MIINKPKRLPILHQYIWTFNESLPEEEHNYVHVGKVGSFVPVVSGADGGLLLRRKDDSYSAVVGSKGYRWKESSIVKASQCRRHN